MPCCSPRWWHGHARVPLGTRAVPEARCPPTGEPRPELPSPAELQPQRNPSETQVSWKESLFICLIKMCSPGTQTPFHLSHLEPRPSKIKPNKYQTRESKGHM